MCEAFLHTLSHFNHYNNHVKVKVLVTQLCLDSLQPRGLSVEFFRQESWSG